jgi:predicted nucleic acid-binding Zn ribbon protein
MSLTPISAITLQLQDLPGWEGVRDWGLIIRAWKLSVSPIVAERTRPKSFARGVLTIATHSSSLAHQLAFGRVQLRQQLNAHLGGSIDDLRFMAVGFSDSSQPTATENLSIPIYSGEIVICPHCHSRARQGELLRWDVCQFCAIELGILGKRSGSPPKVIN